MASLIKTRPATLNESTLETNIVGEIKDMFDTPFGIFYPIRFRRMFDILPIDFRRFRRRKTKIYRLTPREEGGGGGWDSSFVIPNGTGRDDRIVFIQFKAGEHSDGNSIPNSIFNINIKNPNKHAAFTFNDNDNKKTGKLATQHSDLKRLNDHLITKGLSAKSVLYAFPRITSLREFELLDDPLITRTTFLSVTEMDAEAKKSGVNLHDGKRHHFRTCYHDESHREISSEPFTIEQDASLDILEEIMLVKMYRVWNEYFDEMDARRIRDYLILSSSLFLNVNPFQVMDKPFEYYYPEEMDFLLRQNRQDFSSSKLNIELFIRTFYSIKGKNDIIDINEAVPTKYTTPLSFIENKDLDSEENLGEINVSALVF